MRSWSTRIQTSAQHPGRCALKSWSDEPYGAAGEPILVLGCPTEDEARRPKAAQLLPQSSQEGEAAHKGKPTS